MKNIYFISLVFLIAINSLAKGTNDVVSNNQIVTISKTEPGFKHYIGEIFNGGIVFHVALGKDGLEHGLIVALKESTETWQTSLKLVKADRNWDGAYNTAQMKESPAADYVATLGEGWFLPAIDEMTFLYDNLSEVNRVLTESNNVVISKKTAYWTSVEFFSTIAYKFDFNDGLASTNGKKNSYLVRGIKAF